MKNTFGQWFMGKGIKSYALPYSLFAVATIALVLSAKYYPGSLVGPNTPWGVSLGLGIAYFGFGIGITYHMVDAYKNSEK